MFRNKEQVMNILIVDGQGGGIGRQLVEAVKREFPQFVITAVGTNTIATQGMLKSGADHAATGENAVIVGCRTADVIIGPVGIVIADSLWGEITPAIATAIGQSRAVRILLPMNQCSNLIMGISDISVTALIRDTLAALHGLAVS